MHDLILVRIELAKYYLTNHALSIADVAELSGFWDLAHFSRCFRRYVGCSPRQFRVGRVAPEGVDST